MTAPTAASIRRGALVPRLTADTLPFSFAIVHQVIWQRETDHRTATDSSSDSNTGGPLWFRTSRGAEGAQVADAHERC
jgi:hypothetical protein